MNNFNFNINFNMACNIIKIGTDFYATCLYSPIYIFLCTMLVTLQRPVLLIRMFRIPWTDRISNKEALNKACVERSLLNIIRNRQLLFVGHIREERAQQTGYWQEKNWGKEMQSETAHQIQHKDMFIGLTGNKSNITLQRTIQR